MLQNIHLMPKWLVELEKILDSFSGDTGSHINFQIITCQLNLQLVFQLVFWIDQSSLPTSLHQVLRPT
jgi:hypothetical protein